jgi:hypothetical protein
MFLTPTTEREVADTIKIFSNKISTGIDDFLEFITKRCYPQLVNVLTKQNKQTPWPT